MVTSSRWPAPRKPQGGKHLVITKALTTASPNTPLNGMIQMLAVGKAKQEAKSSREAETDEKRCNTAHEGHAQGRDDENNYTGEDAENSTRASTVS